MTLTSNTLPLHTLCYIAYITQSKETKCIQQLQIHRTHQDTQKHHTCTQHGKHTHYRSHYIPKQYEYYKQCAHAADCSEFVDKPYVGGTTVRYLEGQFSM